MARGSTPTGFALSDLLTRLVPGGIVVLAGSLAVTGDVYALDRAVSTGSLLLFAVLAVVVGEVINTVRWQLAPVPPSFRRLVYAERGDPAALSLLDGLRRRVFGTEVAPPDAADAVTVDVTGAVVEGGSLSPERATVRELYLSMLVQLEDGLSPSVRRLLVVHEFAENLKYAVVVAVVVMAARVSPLAVAGTVAFSAGYLLLIYLVAHLVSTSPRFYPVYVNALVLEYAATRDGT